MTPDTAALIEAAKARLLGRYADADLLRGLMNACQRQAAEVERLRADACHCSYDNPNNVVRHLTTEYDRAAADLSAAQTSLAATQTVIAAVEQVALRLADKAERALQLRDAAERGHMLSVADFQRGQAVANEHASIALREILNPAPVLGRANDALGDTK